MTGWDNMYGVFLGRDLFTRKKGVIIFFFYMLVFRCVR